MSGQRLWIKELGSILLLLGTCIGGGMLALPIVTAHETYAVTALYLLLAWAAMTLGAWMLTSVSLAMPVGSNFISMTRKTCGGMAVWVTWFVYLLLLYSLLCAYLAGSSDVLQSLLQRIDISLSRNVSIVISAVVFGAIVFRGLYSVDMVNRFLMFGKMAVALALIFALIPHGHISWLKQGDHLFRRDVWWVMICSFGYATLMPSLADYLGRERLRVRRVLILGSLVPLVMYLLWIAAVQASLAHTGPHGLVAMDHASDTTSSLMNELSNLTRHPLLQDLSIIFVSVCTMTALLGVSAGMIDFLADGLNRQKTGLSGVGLLVLMYLPPVVIVSFKPSIFIDALSYAGFLAFYLLVLLPILMLCRVRWGRSGEGTGAG